MLSILVPAGAAAILIGTQYGKVPYDADFEAVGASSNVEANLLRAIARQESNFNADAIGGKNANGTRDYGIMQINERTALAKNVSPLSLIGSAGVRPSIKFAADLLLDVRRELGEKASTFTIVAAYNAGSPAIKERGIFNSGYVADVLFHLQMYALAGLFKGR